MQPLELNDLSFTQELNVSSDPSKIKIIAARMKRAEFEDEVEREKRSCIEYRLVNSDEEEIVVLEEDANAWLFDRTVTHLRGLRLPGEPREVSSDWREATPELIKAIPSSWKSAFIRGSRVCSAKLIEPDEDDVIVGLDGIQEVDLVIGDEDDPRAVLKFEIPEATESERRAYADKAARFTQSRGKKQIAKVVTNLRESVRFFKTLMKRPGANITGATYQGKTFLECENPLSKEAFLDSILPTYVQRVINAALTKYNARLQD